MGAGDGATPATTAAAPRRGQRLGTGIRRALSEWDAIDFTDDREACTFKAVIGFKKVQREPEEADIGAVKAPIPDLYAPIPELQMQMLALISTDTGISYSDIAGQLGKNRTTVMRNIRKLKELGVLERVGSRKTGHWKVNEMNKL